MWLRRWDSNPRYRGYEPRDLAAGLPRNNDGGTSPRLNHYTTNGILNPASEKPRLQPIHFLLDI